MQQFNAQLLKQFTSKAVYYYFFPLAHYLEINIAGWFIYLATKYYNIYHYQRKRAKEQRYQNKNKTYLAR